MPMEQPSIGVLIRDVTPAEFTGKAGLEPGDLIIKWDGRPVRSPRELRAAIASTPCGKEVDLVVRRDGKEQTITIKAGTKRSPVLARTTYEAFHDARHQVFKKLEKPDRELALSALIQRLHLARETLRTTIERKEPPHPLWQVSYDRGVQDMADWQTDLGYISRILWMKQGTERAWQLLIGMIDALGPPRQWSVETGPPKSTPVEDIKLVQEACGKFALALGSTRWVGYFWNRPATAVEVLGHGKLRLPQALQGTVWTHDLSRRALFGDAHGPVWVPATEGRRRPRGTFQQRERVDRPWATQFAWDRSRIAILLNWRKGENRGGVCGDLELAVRYFAGWLSASRLNVSEHNDEHGPFNRAAIIASVADAVNARDGRTRRRRLETAVMHALGAGEGWHQAVHWAKPEMNSGGRPHEVVVLPDSDYDNRAQPPFGPAYDCRLLDNGLVARSLSALAVAWRAPVLVRDLEQPICEDDQRRWRDLSVPRRGWRHNCELAVPILHRGRVLGVISVEHKARAALQRDHVRRVELVSRLYAALQAAHPALDEKTWRWLQGLTGTAEPPASGNALLRRFSEWAIQGLGPDLAYASIYDGRARAFEPVGIRARRSLLVEYTRALAKDLGEGQADLFPQKTKAPERCATLERICERSLSPELRASPRGVTWRTFTELERHTWWNTRNQRRRVNAPRRLSEHFASAVCVPFACSDDAQPHGAFWMMYRVAPKSVGVGGPPIKDELSFRRAVLTPLRTVLQTVAALYAVHKYAEMAGRLTRADTPQTPCDP